MIFENAMSFKAKINKVAMSKNIAAQQLMQNYLLEAFLTKISHSKYRDDFIVKGGFLIGGIIGIDLRSTMDLDTTIKGFDLTVETLSKDAKEIIETPSDESFISLFPALNLLGIQMTIRGTG